MNQCAASVKGNDNESEVEVIGDEIKKISFDNDHKKIKHVCILNVHPNYTIEAVHGNHLKISPTKENEQVALFYPHDAEQVLKELDQNIIVQTVNLTPNVRQSIATIRRLKHQIDIFINLYDNADGAGIKIVDYMQNQGIAFTGAGTHFYDPTRIELKQLCRYCRLSTPKFALMTDPKSYDDDSLANLSKTLGDFPLFIKPEHGYDSVGINEKSLIFNLTDLKECCTRIVDEFGGALIEKYIEGREFTVLVAGSKDNIHVFPPVEYRFLANKTFITFDDKWGQNYTDLHWCLLNKTNEQEEQLIDDLTLLARQLYESFDGDGYARIDIRQDNKTKELFILDCNPNCSLFYKDLCSADAIIELSGWPKVKFMKFLFEQALEPQRRYYLTHSYTIKYLPQSGVAMYASRNLFQDDLVYSQENTSLKLVTKQFAEQTFSKTELMWFNHYGMYDEELIYQFIVSAWPICDNVFILWHEDSRKWTPINHSCDPNVWINGLDCIARRYIPLGEELTIDYATYLTTIPSFQCWCGTSICRGQIKSDAYKEKWFQDRYGFGLWNDMFNVPPVNTAVLYGIYQSLGRITNEFLEKGKRYDPTIDDDELFKAGRTVWFMIAFQTQMNLSLSLTDSIFGYNMLYPYTDDLVDCNDVSREAKKDFARIFHERLLIGASNYDPKSHFNGQQSNVTLLKLPPSLQPYADRVGKIFDMVKFIENDWTRNEHQGVYMGLATIHESQMKSTLQHAQPDNGYIPTMAQIEQISAEKGGASLIAAVFLIEGRLTRAKMAYLEYLGFGLQMLDDLQDVEEDMKNNHRTIFTQSLADGQTLDAPTARLIQYCYYAPAFEKFSDDHRTVSDAQSGETLAHYVRASMMMFSVLLILEAVSRLQQYYSEEFYREISTFSPLPFDVLKMARVEKIFWTVVRDQSF
ncbi:unnamed protein product [Rotaria sordida]|uniref:Uncharacterized protein n=1 Tax=Rotaria sordida TaxID=392033 RepID=A0A819CRA8_9BILA|nr:unnamed protein product [Rotaria sordida]